MSPKLCGADGHAGVGREGMDGGGGGDGAWRLLATTPVQPHAPPSIYFCAPIISLQTDIFLYFTDSLLTYLFIHSRLPYDDN